MSSFKSSKLSQVCLVTLVCVVSLTTLPIKGFCDDWVYVGRLEYFLIYYNNIDINIDRKYKMIKVWIKFQYTEKGKETYFNERINKGMGSTGYQNLSYSLQLFVFDFENWRFDVLSGVYYSSTGEILTSFDNPNLNLRKTIPESIASNILYKILGDHNIKR